MGFGHSTGSGVEGAAGCLVTHKMLVTPETSAEVPGPGGAPPQLEASRSLDTSLVHTLQTSSKFFSLFSIFWDYF